MAIGAETEVEQDREQESPPETLVEQVKGALEHLYDLNYLQHHPLVQAEGRSAGGPAEIAGQRLRGELAGAVESLNPGPAVPFRAPQARLYNLLTLHYVEGITVQEAAYKLGVSRRQAHRDLRRGLEDVAAVLWARRSSAPDSPGPRAFQISSVQAEMARLAHRPQSADLCALLQRAREIVERLATQREIRFQTDTCQQPVVLSTDSVVAEQVLVDTLSRAVQQACPGVFDLSLAMGEAEAVLTLRYFPDPEMADSPAVNLMATQLVDRLGWTIGQEDQADGYRVVTLRIAPRGPTVLVIDDNEGLVKLLKRYLTDQACRVVETTDGEEGLRLAQELLPDAIALDVMMPGMHGWDVLQRLRNKPRTASIPVIIISVFNDPELAYSLGASHFLPKPVSRVDVLDALRQVGVL